MEKKRKKAAVLRLVIGLILGLAGCAMNKPQQLNSAIAQAMQSPDHHTAEEKLRVLIQQHPKHPLLHSALGYQLDQQHRFSEALKAYQKSVQLAPQDTEWHNNFGVFLCQHGNTNQGQQELKKASRQAKGEEKSWALENIERCQTEHREETPR